MSENGHSLLNLKHKTSSQLWVKLVEEISASSKEKIIVSWEGFSFFTFDDIKFIASCFVNFDVNVIVYIRRQDEVIQSGIAQNIKQGNNSHDLEHYVNNEVYFAERDYLRLLEKWEKVFGNKKFVY
jgi:hypothetical protein